MPVSARARASGSEIEPSHVLDQVGVLRRPDVQHPQLVVLRQVRGDERADHAGSADEQDLHRDCRPCPGYPTSRATVVLAMIVSYRSTMARRSA